LDHRRGDGRALRRDDRLLPPPRLALAVRGGGSAAGDGRQDRDLVAVVHRSVEAVAEADVLAAHVDVHETTELAVLRDPVAQALVPVVEGVAPLPDRPYLHPGLGLVAGRVAQLGRALDRPAHHALT